MCLLDHLVYFNLKATTAPVLAKGQDIMLDWANKAWQRKENEQLRLSIWKIKRDRLEVRTEDTERQLEKEP